MLAALAGARHWRLGMVPACEASLRFPLFPQAVAIPGLAASAALMLATGCGSTRVQQLETELQTLRDDLDELKRSQAAARVQFDELRSRLVMVEEKADSARVDRSRKESSWIPKLPTVRVGPGQVAPRAVEAEEEAGGELPDTPVAVAVPPPTPSPSGPGGDLPPQLDNQKPKGDPAVVLYNQAKALLDSEQLPASRAAFEQLLQAHPDHDLADNALYWIGESWYAQSHWLKAASFFVRVAKEYPRGNKVPDAMYKLAKSYEKLGDDAGASDVLRQLCKHYPGTPAAKRAGDDLAHRPARTEP